MFYFSLLLVPVLVTCPMRFFMLELNVFCNASTPTPPTHTHSHTPQNEA
jgi:hypothetical protein